MLLQVKQKEATLNLDPDIPVAQDQSNPKIFVKGGSPWQSNMEEYVACQHVTPKNITLKWKRTDVDANIPYNSSYENFIKHMVMASVVGMSGDDPN